MAVKLRRTGLELSQEALANNAHLARSFVSGIERGTANASIESVWKIAEALGCKPSDLWVEAEKRLAEKYQS